MKHIITVLEERKERLAKIVNTQYPIDPSLTKAHEERVYNAKVYINELEQLISTLTTDTQIYVVPANTFESKIEKADFATIEDEGLYFRLAYITNFPGENLTLLYLAPLSAI